MNDNYYTHLSLNDRVVIQTGCENGSSKKSIADTIGKDPTTVAKEIRNHRILKHKTSLSLECSNYAKCKYGRQCSDKCPDYKPFICKRRDRSPGVCNGCSNNNKCRFNKYYYSADLADKEYKASLVETRQGFDTSLAEIKKIGSIIEPLLKQGQSLEQIMLTHKDEIGVSLRTLYTYVESHLFKDVGFDIGPMSLRRQVSRKLPKKRANEYKKRNDFKYLSGRLYSDYQNYINENPNANVVEMDTVYNDIEKGPFVQTFKFLKYGFLFCIYHDTKTSDDMNQGVLLLENILGKELFSQEVEILLTDRGNEFYGLHTIEQRDDSTIRTRVFYCDPMASGQKGSLENKHIELRYVLPKRCNLSALGLTCQDKMNIVISHVDSSPRKKLNGKSPIELMEFLNPLLLKKFLDFGIQNIPRDKVILKPNLIK